MLMSEWFLELLLLLAELQDELVVHRYFFFELFKFVLFDLLPGLHRLWWYILSKPPTIQSSLIIKNNSGEHIKVIRHHNPLHRLIWYPRLAPSRWRFSSPRHQDWSGCPGWRYRYRPSFWTLRTPNPHLCAISPLIALEYHWVGYFYGIVRWCCAWIWPRVRPSRRLWFR